MLDSVRVKVIVYGSYARDDYRENSVVDVMKIAENVHLIRQEFYVTPEVKRFINIYLIVG